MNYKAIQEKIEGFKMTGLYLEEPNLYHVHLLHVIKIGQLMNLELKEFVSIILDIVTHHILFVADAIS